MFDDPFYFPTSGNSKAARVIKSSGAKPENIPFDRGEKPAPVAVDGLLAIERVTNDFLSAQQTRVKAQTRKTYERIIESWREFVKTHGSLTPEAVPETGNGRSKSKRDSKV